MKLLALDTAGELCSVALFDGAVWHERSIVAGQSHSQHVLPMVQECLAHAALRLQDLDGIAFGAGPGAFTGVRIACGVAQGLAFGANLPVVPVPTLLALAQHAWREHQATNVFACLDARMREVYVAFYAREANDWRVVRPPA